MIKKTLLIVFCIVLFCNAATAAPAVVDTIPMTPSSWTAIEYVGEDQYFKYYLSVPEVEMVATYTDVVNGFWGLTVYAEPQNEQLRALLVETFAKAGYCQFYPVNGNRKAVMMGTKLEYYPKSNTIKIYDEKTYNQDGEILSTWIYYPEKSRPAPIIESASDEPHLSMLSVVQPALKRASDYIKTQRAIKKAEERQLIR